MRLALDTNSYCAAGRGDARTVALVRRATVICLPFVVLGELRAGFAAGTIGQQNDAILTRFLGSPRVTILWADEHTTHHYANLFAQLKRQGTPIPTNDIWIAALVVQHDLALLTRDEHFSKLGQIAKA